MNRSFFSNRGRLSPGLSCRRRCFNWIIVYLQAADAYDCKTVRQVFRVMISVKVTSLDRLCMLNISITRFDS